MQTRTPIRLRLLVHLVHPDGLRSERILVFPERGGTEDGAVLLRLDRDRLLGRLDVEDARA
jgi:hypothetical protein